MPEISRPDDTGAHTAIGDEKPANHPLAHLFATVERSVNEIRTSEISSWDVRQQARARDRGQNQAWVRIRNGNNNASNNNRPRGAR